jgi:thiamine-phosphate pyrophosphorylase
VSEEKKFPPLYPILDAQLALRDVQDRWTYLREIVHELSDAGVELLQYRDKEADDLKFIEEALVIREAAPALMRLIVNDRAALVSLTQFDGVHVGQEDMAPAEARKMVGVGRMVGISTHNAEQLRRADVEPVDYIAIGPVFATESKQNPDPVVGLEGVQLARRLTSKPLVAIGGITLENASSVYEAGADSLAVISALFGRDKTPGKIAKDILQKFK